MSSIAAGNAGMSSRLARNICEIHYFTMGGRISLVACCSAAKVLYLLLWTVDHPVDSTCQWLLAARQPMYCTCCYVLSITPSNLHVNGCLLLGSQCTVLVVMDCRSPRRIYMSLVGSQHTVLVMDCRSPRRIYMSMVACCSAANVLYLSLWTADHPVESTCRWSAANVLYLLLWTVYHSVESTCRWLAANVLYLLLCTVDHPVESTCQWLLAGRQPMYCTCLYGLPITPSNLHVAGRQPTYCTCCYGLSITPSNLHVSEPLIAEPLPSVGEVDQLFQIASHFHSQVVMLPVRGSSHHTSP